MLFKEGQEIPIRKSSIKCQISKTLVFISRGKLRIFHRLFCFFMVSASKQRLKKDWAFARNQKCPFCTLASKSNATLAQALRLKILQSFTRKSLSGDRRFYLRARK